MKKGRLAFVRNSLKDILDNISTYSLLPDKLDNSWYRKDEGSIVLEDGGMEEYKSVRNKLLQEFSKEEDLSESALDFALKTAIFEFVDIPKRRDEDPDVRLNKAIEKLRKFLNRPPEQYECYIEVGGLDIASLPASFGGVSLVVFNNYQLGKLRKTIRTKHTVDLFEKLEVVNIGLKTLLNHPLAVVKVNARDNRAAKILAERKVRTTIECLNFFSGVIAKNSTLFLPTEPRSNSIRGFSVAESGFISIFDMFTDIAVNPRVPAAGFSLTELRQSSDSMVRRATRHLGALLKKENRNKVEDVMLRAVYWGGRATAEQTPEESFLFFTVALECLILPTRDPRELGYRLSQRVAQLLGRNTRERRNFMERTKKLYAIRSEIVHSGRYEVNEEQYAEIYNITKSTILKLLASQHVRGFSQPDDFENWLKELSL